MVNNLHKDPYSSTGPVNTEQSQFFFDFELQIPLTQRLVIDWFQFTLKYEYLESSVKLNLNVFEFFKKHIDKEYLSKNEAIARYLFKFFFGLDDRDIIYENRGLNGYSYRLSYRNIILLFSDNPNMGFNFMLSGQACRDFEDLDLKWNDLFEKISSFEEFNITRIDLAIDDFTNKYYSINKIKRYLRNGQVTSKHIKALDIREFKISDNTEYGNSLQIGSKASRVQIEFYDKKLERANANFILNNKIKYWYRMELRFRQETATELFIKLNNDINNLYDVILGTLNNYICFREKSPTDSNKSRWPIASWWLKYLDNVKKLHLSTIKYDTNIMKGKAWLNKTVSKTQLRVLIAELKDLNILIDDETFNFIEKQLLCNYDFNKSMNKKDIEIINQYRMDHNMSILSIDEVNSFIQDIKDSISWENPNITNRIKSFKEDN